MRSNIVALAVSISTSAKKDMFYAAFSVCVFVSLIAFSKTQKLLTNFDEIFGGLRRVTIKN